LFDDTIDSLRALRTRFKVGLVSDAQRVFSDSEIEMTGLSSLLDVVVISTDYGYHKPDRRLFDMAVDSLGTTAERALYVGDNVRRDICGAKNAQLTSVLLSRRGKDHPDLDLCKPDRIVRSLHELCEWLLSGQHVLV